MSMHLVGPYLTTTNYRKRKVTVTKTKQAQWEAWWQDKNRELKRQGMPKISYEQFVDELHGRVHKTKLRPNQQGQLNTNYEVPVERSTANIPSRDSWQGTTAKKESPKYTGDKMLGIGVLHKSNAVPIFRVDDAKDISTMRRG